MRELNLKSNQGAKSSEELIAEIRFALRPKPEIDQAPCQPSFDENPCDATSTDALESDSHTRQPGQEINESALAMADQILGTNAPVSQMDHAQDLSTCCMHLLLNGERVDIPVGGLVLGRGPNSFGAQVLDSRVSRNHVRIEQLNTDLVATDLGSTNGTTIIRNGERIEIGSMAISLCRGDILVTSGDVLLAEISQDDVMVPEP